MNSFTIIRLLIQDVKMYKNILSLAFTIIFVSTITFGMMPDISNNSLQTEKAKIEKELKKNEAELQTFKKNEKLAPAIAKIEPILNKIVTSAEFKATIETITTKQAEEITQGKTFTEVKYNHSLSNEFPNMTNAHKLLARIYSLMANIKHYQLLLEKLGNAKAINTQDNNIQETQSTEMPQIADFSVIEG